MPREAFKESTNNLSLAEELKFHVVHNNNNNTNNNDNFDDEDDFDLININNSNDDNKNINTNNNNNNIESVNYTSDDDISYERVFKKELILKRDRYNHYLNTVTTSIDEYDKKKKSFDDSE